MPSAQPLGKLSRIADIRGIWPHERYDFSAWMLENPEALAEVLEIELELERVEEPVGDFSLDLIGRDLTNGAVLMIENHRAMAIETSTSFVPSSLSGGSLRPNTVVSSGLRSFRTAGRAASRTTSSRPT